VQNLLSESGRGAETSLEKKLLPRTFLAWPSAKSLQIVLWLTGGEIRQKIKSGTRALRGQKNGTLVRRTFFPCAANLFPILASLITIIPPKNKNPHHNLMWV